MLDYGFVQSVAMILFAFSGPEVSTGEIFGDSPLIFRTFATAHSGDVLRKQQVSHLIEIDKGPGNAIQ